jgi:voltage-gated potassium channel Kch
MPLILATLRALRTLRRDRQFVSLAMLMGIAIVMGTVFYWLVEGLGLLDSFYFSVVTLATVGYGDFTPETAAGKIFTAFYVLIGVGLTLAFVTRIAGQTIASHAEHLASRNGHRPDDRELPDEAVKPEDRRRR